ICSGQAFYYRLDLRSPLTELAILLRRRVWALDLALIRTVTIFGFKALLVYRVPAHVIDRRVVSNAIEPRGKLVFRTIFFEGIVNFDEDFLRDIQRGIIIVQHPIYIIRDRTLITAHKLLETILAAADGLSDEFDISHFLNVFESRQTHRPVRAIIRY